MFISEINSCSTIFRNVIERFVLDEIDSNDLKNSASFDDVLLIYKKLYKSCCNVTNHININGSNEADDRYGSITNRKNSSNKVENLTKSKNSINDSEESEDDSISSNSMSAFKRNNIDKVENTKITKQNTNATNNIVEEFGLKPQQKNDDFFNFASLNKNEEKMKSSQSSLGDLPPLNNSNNFQNSKDFFSFMVSKLFYESKIFFSNY